MCSHYSATTDPERLRAAFGVDPSGLLLKGDMWPLYRGPFVRMSDPAQGPVERELQVGAFGLIPHWAETEKEGRGKYNARSETVALKNSYRDAWRLARHCIVPADGFYEPDWRTGESVPTRIARADGKPLGIAGIWTGWRQPNGEVLRSYSMLTVNADEHPLMRNYHKPGDEKRMVVILPEEDYEAWLTAPVEASMAYMRQYPAELLVAHPEAK